jgi:hypothetical protein
MNVFWKLLFLLFSLSTSFFPPLSLSLSESNWGDQFLLQRKSNFPSNYFTDALHMEIEKPNHIFENPRMIHEFRNQFPESQNSSVTTKNPSQ